MSKKKSKGKDGNEKICAALSYILIGIIWYFVDEKMKKDKFVKFHVKQGIVLLVASIAWAIVLNIVFGTLTLGLFWIFWQLWSLLSYVPLIFVIIGIVNAVNNKEKELPVIGKFASKLTF